jgi:hypothetical protein
MKILHWLWAFLLCALLAACGGDGPEAGTPPFGGGASAPTSSATSIDVLATSVQVGSGGETTTVQAVVKGAGNVGLSGVAVAFATDTGTLTNAAAATDASGVATATFSAGANRTNRLATVTVSSGNAVGSVQIQIAGTKLTYSGATTVPLGQAVPVSVKAVDSTGAPIASLAVAISSSLGNGLSASSVVTDATGNGTVTYTATHAGNDTLTFSGGGTSITPQLIISAANFSFTSPAANTQVAVGASQALTVTYLVNGQPQANQTITFTSTVGVVTPSSSTTNAQGQATAAVASSTAGPAVVQASVSGASVQATLPLSFVAQSPAKVVLQISPTALSPNLSGNTTQQSTVLATVTDGNANPVSGATVNFNAVTDPSGGHLSQASAATDSSGQASVQYIAGPNTSPAGGVQLQATALSCTPVSAGSCTASANLTVTGSALFIALGTGNTIGNSDPQTYQKDYTVYVTDANGNAVQGVNLTMSVIPTRYGKGQLVYSGGSWVYGNNVVFCANEDLNLNGVLDPGEDFNGNGRLDPGNVVLLSTGGAAGQVTTDAQGRATISLFYAESYAPWVEVKLKAQATVSGTESSTFTIFTIAGSSADFTSATTPPAGVQSPFGVNACNMPN